MQEQGRGFRANAARWAICCLLAGLLVAGLLFPVAGGVGLVAMRVSDSVDEDTTHIVQGTRFAPDGTLWAFDTFAYKIVRFARSGRRLPPELVALAPATHTTPDAAVLHELLAQFAAAGAQAVAMEVSSHGLDQGRVGGMKFDVALFTNLTRDHLDYHKTMAAYGAAKAKLFTWPGLRAAVINADDPFGQSLIEAGRARGQHALVGRARERVVRAPRDVRGRDRPGRRGDRAHSHRPAQARGVRLHRPHGRADGLDPVRRQPD